MRPTLIATAVAATALLLAGCTASGSTTAPASSIDPPTVGLSADDPVGTPAPPVRPVAAQLVSFDSCDALLAYYVDTALDLVGPFGLGGGPMFAEDMELGVESEASGVDAALADGAESVARDGEEFSTTNVQEEGVDEPDRVKTDGEVIVTMANGDLRVVDVASAEVIGRLDLPDETWNAELLFAGDDLLVLSSGGDVGNVGGPAADGLVPGFRADRTTVTRVDLSDPSSPAVTGSVVLEGGYRSARMVDGTVRLVMVSQPTGLRFVQPEDGGLAAEQEATERNRQLLRESDLDDWIPHLQVRDADGAPVGEVQRVLDCEDISRPTNVAGLSTLSVLTLAIDGDELTPSSGAGLVAAGDTVYASTDRLVVATSPWGQWIQPFVDRLAPPKDDQVRTDLHTFDISEPTSTTHVASGSVAGTLIGQFALSEVEGTIRVATTTQPDWWAGGNGGQESQSSLVVLAEDGEELAEVGRVDGLGVTERIYAVRYLGPDLAAIVTFRETDPLYLVDTSDPTDPTVTGELKIPGFSTYLHPVGDGRLVGVGQDADDQGRTLGLQASLFDVSDITDPQRVDQVTFDGAGFSPVEYDHRAFLHWSPTGQVVLPVELWDREREQVERDCEADGDCIEPKPFLGAVVLRVDDATMVEQGRVSLRDDGDVTTDWWGQVVRSIVIGDDLWLIADDRLLRVTLDGLDDRIVVPLR